MLYHTKRLKLSKNRKFTIIFGISFIIMTSTFSGFMKKDFDEEQGIIQEFDNTLVKTSGEINIGMFSFYKNITIDREMVNGTETLENFPVLISMIDEDLKEYVQEDGDDIAFFNGTEQLDHEIKCFNQTYNDTHALLIVWVRIPSLYATQDTKIIMYYCNTTMTSQQNPAGVWDSNYRGVWHLSEDPTGAIYDSTINDNDGTSSGDMTQEDQVEGVIDGSLDFDGGDDYIDFGDKSSLDITNDITIEFWINISYDIVSIPDIFMQGEYDESYSVSINGQHEVRFSLNGIHYEGPEINEDEWYHVACTRANGRIYFYLNGKENISYPFSAAIEPVDSNTTLSKEGWTLDGMIDELRLSSTGRSASWIATQYNNMNDPNNFYSISLSSANDTIPPTTELFFISDHTQDYVNASTMFTLLPSDPYGSGINKTSYKIDDGTWVEYITPFNLSNHDDGIHYILYNSTDNFNNTEITHNKTVYLYNDNTAPDTDIEFISDFTLNYVNGSTVFTFSADDGEGSGVSTTLYRFDVGSWVIYNDVSFNLSDEPDGTIRIQYYSTDMMNNTEEIRERTVYLYRDTSTPTSILNFNGNNAAVNETTVFSLTGDDGSGSGVAKRYFRIDDGNWQEYVNPFTLYSLGLNEGNHTIEHYCIDNVGNNGSVSIIEVTYALINNTGDITLLIAFISLLLLLLFGIFITVSVMKVRKRAKVKTVKSKNIKSKYKPPKIGQLDENELIINDTVEVICPICNTIKKVVIPNIKFENAKSVRTISIPKDSVCPHHFQAFVDRDLAVRGYQKVDVTLDHEAEKAKSLAKNLSDIKDDTPIR